MCASRAPCGLNTAVNRASGIAIKGSVIALRFNRLRCPVTDPHDPIAAVRGAGRRADGRRSILPAPWRSPAARSISTGLDHQVGLLCAKSLDLPPDEGRRVRPRLIALSGCDGGAVACPGGARRAIRLSTLPPPAKGRAMVIGSTSILSAVRRAARGAGADLACRPHGAVRRHGATARQRRLAGGAGRAGARCAPPAASDQVRRAARAAADRRRTGHRGRLAGTRASRRHDPVARMLRCRVLPAAAGDRAGAVAEHRPGRRGRGGRHRAAGADHRAGHRAVAGAQPAGDGHRLHPHRDRAVAAAQRAVRRRARRPTWC